MEWFDSHCHLHLCDDPPEVLVERAARAGVASLLTVGIDVASSEAAVRTAESLGVWAAAGVHPNEAFDWGPGLAERIAALLAHEKTVAVGETGLDFLRDRCPPDVQHRAFADHIALAKEHGKALVIHTRASVDAALEQLEDAGPPARLVFHCWSGDDAQVARALALGAYISFAGNVSFKGAENLRAAARVVPEDRLLVETDTPYLAPVPHRGHPNEPAHVPDVGRAIAAARDVHPEAIADATTRNARALFALP